MFKSQKQLEIIVALIIIIVLGLGIVSNIKNPINKDGLLQFRVDGSRAYANGFTDGRSVGYAKAFFKDNPQVETIVLQNMSGTQNADQNLRIAREIRRLGLNTHLQKRSRIASGAVDLFIAGRQRTIDCGAKIGVHSWSGGGIEDAQKTLYDNRQKIQERYLSDMGIDPSFYVFTRNAAPAKSLHIMSNDEVRRYGLTTQPHECGL